LNCLSAMVHCFSLTTKQYQSAYISHRNHQPNMAFVFYIVMSGSEGILGERCEIGIGFRFFVAPPP